MSLAAIRSVRLRGHRPGVVTVVIGPIPGWMDDDEQHIVIGENDNPAAMDWRPVVGLWLALFQTARLPELTASVMDHADAAGAKFFGAADHTGTYPMVLNSGPEHHAVLRSSWENLCLS
jgi:hypothetical protein